MARNFGSLNLKYVKVYVYIHLLLLLLLLFFYLISTLNLPTQDTQGYDLYRLETKIGPSQLFFRPCSKILTIYLKHNKLALEINSSIYICLTFFL